MSQTFDQDHLAVVNGPEDGKQFVLIRSPFFIGREQDCAAALLLDNAVLPKHIQALAAADGYRVRCTSASPVFVNGKKVGMIRSRILRPGDTLKVGNTLMTLHTSPTGLSKRSRGTLTESDIAYFGRRVVGGMLSGLVSALQFGLRFALERWRVAMVLVMIGLVAYAPTRRVVFFYAERVWWQVREIVGMQGL
jgi:hypothetical protein